jgi:hypothetical protein
LRDLTFSTSAISTGQKINPDIFGSMIQAVADDEETRSAWDALHQRSEYPESPEPALSGRSPRKAEEAGDNPRKLLNLRKRMARIRVFDPACGSGNFSSLPTRKCGLSRPSSTSGAVRQARKSDIPLTNFRGIELRDFPRRDRPPCPHHRRVPVRRDLSRAEARLAEFLPLNAENWITCGNALRLDWLSICPPTGTGVKLVGDDLFSTPLDQAQIDFENEGGETYICGNPPYVGGKMLGRRLT